MIFKKSNYDWMIVGLGNPGLQYETTRHNVGFMAAELLFKEYASGAAKHKFEAEYCECKIGNNKVLVVKPQTYMNNSGRAVTAISSFYKIPHDKMIIVSDDVSLDVGKLRIRRKGSHGGHNGLRDIFELLGTDDIIRIKVGVGKKPHPQYDLADWVLSKFPKEESENLEIALKNTVLAIKEIMSRSVDSAMNKYNS